MDVTDLKDLYADARKRMDGQIAHVRREANDRLKKMLKDSLISEDDEKHGLSEVQKITDTAISGIDDLQKKKDDDLLGR